MSQERVVQLGILVGIFEKFYIKYGILSSHRSIKYFSWVKFACLGYSFSSNEPTYNINTNYVPNNVTIIIYHLLRNMLTVILILWLILINIWLKCHRNLNRKWILPRMCQKLLLPTIFGILKSIIVFVLWIVLSKHGLFLAV